MNLSAYESSLESITSLTDLPVLQDSTDDLVAEEYGAYKWFIYVMNKDGSLHIMHYDLPMPTQLYRLKAWIEAAKADS